MPASDDANPEEQKENSSLNANTTNVANIGGRKAAANNDSSEEEKEEDPATVAMWAKIDEILKDYYLSSFAKVACKKFIKDKVGNP